MSRVTGDLFTFVDSNWITHIFYLVSWSHALKQVKEGRKQTWALLKITNYVI
jgi:hypothetical protein